MAGGLASPSKTQDPFALIAIAGGLTYIGASIPFYIRVAKHEKTRQLLAEGAFPVRKFRRKPARFSMHIGISSAAVRMRM